MRALAADGRAAAALSAYDRLARTLREDLGTDPDRATSDLHLALLRETPVDGDAPPSRPRPRGEESQVLLVGREEEVTLFREAWGAVVATAEADLVLVVGEGGIGKTRLLDTVADLGLATGGQVLRGRCHPAERSLFLQPFVDALRPALAGLRRDHLAATLRDHEAAWVSLVPDLAAVLPNAPAPPADRDLQRRATYDAVAAALRRLVRGPPARARAGRPAGRRCGDRRPARLPRPAARDVAGPARRRGPQRGPDGRRASGRPRQEDPPRPPRPGGGGHPGGRRPASGRAVARSWRAPPATPSAWSSASARSAAATPASLPRCRTACWPASTGSARSADPSWRPAPSSRRRLDPRLLAGLAEVSEVAATRHGEELTRAGLLRAQRCGLRVRQRPVPGVRVRRPAGGRGRGLPPAGRRPDQRPARGDGHPRPRRRRRRPRCPGLVARR